MFLKTTCAPSRCVILCVVFADLTSSVSFLIDGTREEEGGKEGRKGLLWEGKDKTVVWGHGESRACLYVHTHACVLVELFLFGLSGSRSW